MDTVIGKVKIKKNQRANLGKVKHDFINGLQVKSDGTIVAVSNKKLTPLQTKKILDSVKTLDNTDPFKERKVRKRKARKFLKEKVKASDEEIRGLLEYFEDKKEE